MLLISEASSKEIKIHQGGFEIGLQYLKCQKKIPKAKRKYVKIL